MIETVTKKHRLVKRVKDGSFNVDELHEYTLSLLVGTRDFQFCVVNKESKVVLLEDYRLEGIKTINTRIRVLKDVFDNHHVLSAGFWKSIKLFFKTHKYTLVPSSLFLPESSEDYIAVNSEIKPSIESVHSFNHSGCDAVNVFVGDARLLSWIDSLYPSKTIEVGHQGAALIEGIIKNGEIQKKSLYANVDRGVLHLVVFEDGNLLYYNQFAVQKSQDILKYTMLVFKEIGLDQRATTVTLWGNLKNDSKHVSLLKKYIKNIEYGVRPKDLKFGFQFDEILDHQYFDLLNIHNAG